LVEKVISLESIALLDFLGPENRNLRKLASYFPQAKIIARGNELRLQGATSEIMELNQVITRLLELYQRLGKITLDDVRACVEQDPESIGRRGKSETIIYAAGGNPVKAKTPNQQALVDSAGENDVVFALGPAGTGKTFIAVALAIRALKNKAVKKIIITRPAVEAGENLGFLPGDLREKIDPYLRPIYDALEALVPGEKLKYYREQNIIEIAPIAYMRGRTLNDAFVILDEAQNTTSLQLKMFLTRLGPDSKMIITGDISQIDLPRKQRSGLVAALHVLRGIKGIGFVQLTGEDVTRHKLVRHIIKAYETHESQLEAQAEKKRKQKRDLRPPEPDNATEA